MKGGGGRVRVNVLPIFFGFKQKTKNVEAAQSRSRDLWTIGTFGFNLEAFELQVPRRGPSGEKRGLGRSLIRRPSSRAYGRGFLVGGWQRCTCPSHSSDKMVAFTCRRTSRSCSVPRKRRQQVRTETLARSATIRTGETRAWRLELKRPGATGE